MRLEFLRFSLVGVVNTFIDFAVFVLLYRLTDIDPLLCNGIAFLVAVTNSYLMNHHWTFRDTGSTLSFKAYIRFVVLNTGGLLIGTLAIVLLGEYMPLELAKLIAAGLTLIWNYTCSKMFVFNMDKT
jgi:putative flippase GtrA